MTALDNYRGWEIHYDPPPIPVRDSDWYALVPDRFAKREGECIYAGSREELVKDIDLYLHCYGDSDA